MDFTKWTNNCARLQKFQIVEVKPPRLGDSYPAAVHATLTFSLKDLGQAARQQWVQDVSQVGTVLYLIGFEKAEKGSTGFVADYGVKLVRGVTVHPRVLHGAEEQLLTQ